MWHKLSDQKPKDSQKIVCLYQAQSIEGKTIDSLVVFQWESSLDTLEALSRSPPFDYWIDLQELLDQIKRDTQ